LKTTQTYGHPTPCRASVKESLMVVLAPGQVVVQTSTMILIQASHVPMLGWGLGLGKQGAWTADPPGFNPGSNQQPTTWI
jgi:hypothetical protein